MTLSMYQASLPVLIRMLENLSQILLKAAAYAENKKLDPATLINARLAPDMFPLVRQVQSVSDTAKGCAARLAGINNPRFSDNESNFPELQERINKTIAFLKNIAAGQIDGSEEREIVLNFPGKKIRFSGQVYLVNFVLPNFYFHLGMAYAILRHNGVEIGKMDFLGEA